MNEEVRLKRYRNYSLTVINDTQPFYGALLSYLPLVFVNHGPNYWCNGESLKFNKKFLLENKITLEQFATITLSMLINYGNMHNLRAKDKGSQKMKYSIASRFCANSEISLFVYAKNNNECYKLISEKSNYFDFHEDTLLDNEYDNKSAEQIYDELPDIPQITISKDENGKIEIFSETPLTPKQIKQIEDALSIAYENNINSPDDENQYLENILSACASCKLQNGNIPLRVERLIQEITTPKIPWTSELQEFLETYVDDYTFEKRDRRYMSNNDFSRLFFPELDGKKLKVAFAYDTSGSMSDKDLKNALSESYHIINTFPKSDMYIISCDADVHDFRKIYDSSEIESHRMIGGGGTSFIPVFDKINDENIDIDVLIFFTDGWGEFPSDYEMNNFKTIWLITTDVQPPFGKKIQYNSEY